MTPIRHPLAAPLVISVVCAIGAFGCYPPGGSTPAAQGRTNAIIVEATSLYQVYERNAVEGDQRYKGQWLHVLGTVRDIGKDILDTPYVTFDVADENALSTVQAMFTRGRDENLLAGFSKGQRLAVVCMGDGKLVTIILRDCAMP